MRDYGAFDDPASPKAALLIECGQHWRAPSAAIAIEATLRFLAAFDIDKAARRRLRQRQRIKRRDVANVHVRPAIFATADVTRYPRCPRLLYQRRNLHALRRSAQRIAVDHRVAQNDSANA